MVLGAITYIDLKRTCTLVGESPVCPRRWTPRPQSYEGIGGTMSGILLAKAVVRRYLCMHPEVYRKSPQTYWQSMVSVNKIVSLGLQHAHQQEELHWAPDECDCIGNVEEDFDNLTKLVHRFKTSLNARKIHRLRTSLLIPLNNQ
jgi:hypothetical protein